MLTEFAMTLDVLEQGTCDSASRELLRELSSGIFPRNGDRPVVLADLYDGSWSAEALKAVARINDGTAKEYAKALLKALMAIRVNRPCVGDWPSDESGWIKEAIATNYQEPMGRIVATAQACGDVREELLSKVVDEA